MALGLLARPALAASETRAHQVLLDPGGGVDLEPPRAFAPLADGTVLLLTPPPYHLVHMDGERRLVSVPLRGPDFDPVAAGLVAMAVTGSRVLLLDQAGGTLWVAGTDGRVTGRSGLFLAPVDLGVGVGGQVGVRDPGSQSVVVLGPDLGDPAARSGEGLAPFPADAGSLPFLRVRRDERAALLGLVPARGEEPRAERLAVLEAPRDQVIFDARVIGARPGEVLVVLQTGGPEDPRPREVHLHRVTTTGEARGAVETRALPPNSNHCLDCGPTYRAGPDGEVWMYQLEHGEYRVLRISGRTQE